MACAQGHHTAVAQVTSTASVVLTLVAVVADVTGCFLGSSQPPPAPAVVLALSEPSLAFGLAAMLAHSFKSNSVNSCESNLEGTCLVTVRVVALLLLSGFPL